MKDDNDRILELLDFASHSIAGEQWRSDKSEETREHTVTKLKEEVLSLRLALSEVESKLRVKEDLCARLETTLHRLVKGRAAPRPISGVANNDIKMTAWEPNMLVDKSLHKTSPLTNYIGCSNLSRPSILRTSVSTGARRCGFPSKHLQRSMLYSRS